MVRLIPFLSIVLLPALASGVGAQTSLAPCATVAVDGPSEVDPGMAVVFSAKITGPIYTPKPEFKWTVSAGTISSGQGTEVITVDSTGIGNGEIVATVELSGIPSGCKKSASGKTQVKMLIADWFPLDRYGDISFEDEKARLDNFAIQLSNEPLTIGHILMYAGQKTFENETTERLARAKSYLVDVRGIDRNRIITVDCGFTQELRIQLSIDPAEFEPPSCNDAISMPFSEVKFIKPRPKTSKKRH